MFNLLIQLWKHCRIWFLCLTSSLSLSDFLYICPSALFLEFFILMLLDCSLTESIEYKASIIWVKDCIFSWNLNKFLQLPNLNSTWTCKSDIRADFPRDQHMNHKCGYPCARVFNKMHMLLAYGRLEIKYQWYLVFQPILCLLIVASTFTWGLLFSIKDLQFLYCWKKHFLKMIIWVKSLVPNLSLGKILYRSS